MNKILLGCLVFAFSTQVAQAQDDKRYQQNRDSLYQESHFNALDYLWQPRYRYNAETWESNSIWDHTYLQVGTGIYQPDTKGSSSLGFLQAMNLTIGHDFSPYHSARVGVGYNFAKGSSASQNNLKYFEGHADWMFNLSNYTAGYKKSRYIDVQTIAGLGVRRSTVGVDETTNTTKSATALEGRLGLDVRFRLGTRNYLSLEPMVVIAQNKGIYPGSHNLIMDYGVNLNWGYYIHPDAVIAHPKDGAEELNPIFFELGVGPVFRSTNGVKTGKTIGPNYSLSVGKWMSPVWGARAGVQLGSAVNGYLDNGNTVNSATVFAGNAELLFNPFGLGQTFNPDQKVGLHLFGGMTYGINNPARVSGTAFHGYTAGVNLWARVDKNADFFIEPRITHLMYAKNFKVDDEDLYSIMAGFRVKTNQAAERIARAANRFDEKYWFMQLAYGFGVNPSETWANGTSDAKWHGDWSLGIGYRWNSLSAARMVVGQTFNWNNGYDYREVLLAPEYMVNINTLLNNYDPEDRFNTWVFAGPFANAYHLSNTDNWHYGVIGGVHFNYALNHVSSLFFEPEARYDLRKSKWEVDYKLGVSHRFDNGVNYDPFWNKNSFFEVGVGVNGMMHASENYGVGTHVQAGFGKWFDRILGAKFVANFNINKSDIHNIYNMGLIADVLVDPIAMLNANYDHRTANWGAYLMFGGDFGLLNERKSSDYSTHLYSGFNEGAQVWTRINPNTRLFVEGRYAQLRNGDWAEDGRFVKPLEVALGLAFDYDVTGTRASHVGRPGANEPTMEETLLRYKKLFEHKYWFIQAEFGGNVNSTRQWSNGASIQNWRGDWGTALGYRWSNLSAARFVLDQNFAVGSDDFRESNLSMQYMLNANALMNHIEGEDKVNLWAFAGPYGAASHENGKDHWYGGISGGLQLDFQLNKTTSIYVAPELRLKMTGADELSLIAKAGISYRFDNGAYYDTFWNENAFMEIGAGAQTVSVSEDGSKLGPHVEFGFGKWFDRVFGAKVMANYGSNNGDEQDIRTIGSSVDVMIDPIGLFNPNYDRKLASAGVYFLLGGQFGMMDEYKDYNFYLGNHLYSGFDEGVQVWLRTSPTSRVFVQGKYAQINAGHWTASRFYRPLTLSIGASFDYNPTFMRESVKDEKPFNLFVQVGAGAQTRLNDFHTHFKSGAALGADLGFTTNGLHGARLSYSWNKVGDQNYMDFAAAYQIDLLRLWQGAESNNTFDLYAFAGPLAQMSKNTEAKYTLHGGARVGAELRVNLFGGTYLHFTPEFDYVSNNGSKTYLKGFGGIGYRF